MFETISLQMPGGTEWLIIGVVIIVLIFGAKKLPQLSRAFGRAKGDYEKGRIESEKDLKDFKENLDSKSEPKSESEPESESKSESEPKSESKSESK